MQREAVKSSQVASIGYDPTAELLEVEFSRGGVYQYLNVPEHVARELMFSDSVGSYFRANVRGAYRTLKVDTETGEAKPLEDRACSERQAEFVRSLLHGAGLSSEAGAEHVHAGMAPLFRAVVGAAEPVLRAAPSIRDWCASLTSEQASTAIEWLKVHGRDL